MISYFYYFYLIYDIIMSKDILSFYNYIVHNNTTSTERFKRFLGNTLDKLPDRICSSKVIYNILKNDLDSYVKHHIFKSTFMEYFKFKLTM
jgi:hypothetical protein